MPYTIDYGSQYLYKPGDESLALASAKMTLSSTGPGKMTISMPRSHTLATTVSVNDFANPVRVSWNENNPVFVGFVSEIGTDMDGMMTLTVDDAMTLLDMPQTSMADNGREEGQYNNMTLLTYIRAAYNNLVPDELKLASLAISSTEYGTIGSSNSDDSTSVGTTIDCDPDAVMSPLQMLLKWYVQQYGAVIRTNWISRRPALSSMRILLSKTAFPSGGGTIKRGENLLRLDVLTSSKDMVNALYVIGSEYETVSGGSGETYTMRAGHRGDRYVQVTSRNDIVEGDTLVIGGYGYKAQNTIRGGGGGRLYLDRPYQWNDTSSSSVTKRSGSFTTERHVSDLTYFTSGSSYTRDGFTSRINGKVIYNKGLADRYGLKMATYSNTNAFQPHYLRDLAHTALKAVASLSKSYAVDALDTCLYGGGVPWGIGSMMHVEDSVQGVNEDMPLSAADVDLLEPSASRYTIGATKRTVTDRLAALGFTMQQQANKR